jgi:hypothetical protein
MIRNHTLYQVYYGEDWWYAHYVNRIGYSMTCKQIALIIIQANPSIQRSTLSAMTQHVAFIRRLVNMKCNGHPPKYTPNVIAFLQNA